MQRRPGRLRRFLKRGLITAFPLLVLVIGGAGGLLWASLPPRDGRIDLPGLGAEVTVLEDAYGIPRITAANELDAARALGWLHARDRMFQMELMRRNAGGRLAELVGPQALRLDRMHRTLGLRRRAEADFAALPPETRAMLEAYAAGVNAWIDARGLLAAPEFLAFGAPEAWQPWQSLLWAKTMGLWLSGNWRTEIDRARLAGVLAPERLAELWPADDSTGHPDREAALLPSDLGFTAGRLTRLADAIPRFPEDAPLPGSASNAWALAPARSESGGALLASDPHLGFGAPILWYLVRIELPGGRFLAGATSPGVPFVVIGRNERLAWGFTTTQSDTQDVFVERLAGADGYETPEGPRPFTLREELIQVRGAEAERLQVRETRHGPVVSDLAGTAAPVAGGTVLAVSMANLEPGDTAAAGLHALNRAGSIAEARSAAARISSPPQNMMVADAAGGIAMYLTGRTPLRRAGDGSQPVPGWDGSHDWIGFLPFDSLPHVENPEGGALANANNRVQPQDSEVFLGRDWHGDWRFRRIQALLGQRPRHRAEDQAAIQHDVVSLFARDVLPALRAIPRPVGAAGVARDLLLSWDGEMAADRPQPLIFNAWWPIAARLALANGKVPDGAWPPTAEFLRFVLHPDGRGAAWCRPAAEAAPLPTPAFAQSGACTALVATALRQAVEELSPQHGPDPSAWRWGTVHQARFEHPMLRFVPLLRDWTAIVRPTPGDDQTVNRAGMAAGFSHVHGPGLRAVFDLATPDGIWAVIGTGQSGHPLSRHWSDMSSIWAGQAPDGVRLLRLGAVPEVSGGSLTLAPSGSSGRP